MLLAEQKHSDLVTLLSLSDAITDRALQHESLFYTPSDIRRIFKRKVYQDVIKSNTFRRLKHIRFLGAIDYLIHPDKANSRKRHTRYDHSLGVARLGLIYSRANKFNKQEEVLCVLAALLHDIGHGPLSHSMESVFVEKFQIGHHLASEEIIRGEISNLTRLWDILDSHGLNHFEVLEIINGTGPHKLTIPFRNPINIDTIEGISRSCSYIYNSQIYYSQNEIIAALISLIALEQHSTEAYRILDSFWRAKHDIYNNLINSRLGVSADYLCQNYIYTNADIKREHFFYDETEFRNAHPEIFDLITQLAFKNNLSKVVSSNVRIDFFKRSFRINNSVILKSVRDLSKRYSQTKEPDSYLFKGSNDEIGEREFTNSGSLFE